MVTGNKNFRFLIFLDSINKTYSLDIHAVFYALLFHFAGRDGVEGAGIPSTELQEG